MVCCYGIWVRLILAMPCMIICSRLGLTKEPLPLQRRLWECTNTHKSGQNKSKRKIQAKCPGSTKRARILSLWEIKKSLKEEKSSKLDLPKMGKIPTMGGRVRGLYEHKPGSQYIHYPCEKIPIVTYLWTRLGGLQT